MADKVFDPKSFFNTPAGTGGPSEKKAPESVGPGGAQPGGTGAPQPEAPAGGGTSDAPKFGTEQAPGSQAPAPAPAATPSAAPSPAPAGPAAGPVSPGPANPGPGGGAAPEADISEGFAISPGTKINRYPIERFRGIKGFNRRVGILTVQRWYGVKTHYEQGMGYFYCFSGVCCDYSDPSVRYLIPVVVYDTDREGTPISVKFEIQYLSVAEAVYDNLLLLNKTARLDTIDIIVSCTDESYQKLTFTPAGPATWRANQEFCNKVWAEYQRLEKHIPRTHARKLGANQAECDATYRRMRGEHVPAGGESGGVMSFDLSKLTQS